ncbi:hypothetical protein [Mesorhizobium sp. LNJC405B00]|uniref:hypothetical protein n=1 Tax=Mesorhizobium sp. LNJC405B00 TaxID=1287281 RepID=UPI0003CEB6CC|nr:hypothetical protein [Mesorhizobium sp. LNJC405B00]ESY01513.1 hypothetical protein X755_06980 [Mesorhizobium sp. LNJC405B00]
MSDAEIYRDSLSAWRALSSIGGLEPTGRDEDLLAQLKQRIDPGAESLEQALTKTPVAQFVTALLATIQPFAQMFRDILAFFEKAGARYGQAQWRVSVGDELAEFKHFEEFLEAWNSIDFDIDVPALSEVDAFALNNARLKLGDYDYWRTRKTEAGRPNVIGVPDVDEWLAAYDAEYYLPLPRSLSPEIQPPGLDEAAKVIMAALHVIHERGLSRNAILEEHRSRSHRSDPSDAFHPWTIAQSETDYWLRSEVLYLAHLLAEPDDTKAAFGAELTRTYALFGRRRFSSTIDVKFLERILSLPAWKRRYEFYGVWVATQVMDALEDHDVTINHDDGALRFAFTETRLADIASSRPLLSVYAERRSPLSNPVGKSRKNAAQPDFGIWTRDTRDATCVLVVEVKHYKKESTTNFGAALADYAKAHPQAKIVLVNYGPATGDYAGLWRGDKDRCIVLGHFNPDVPAAKATFRQVVRSVVGEPVSYAAASTALATSRAVALDVSASMSSILESAWFWGLLDAPEYDDLDFFLIDNVVRGRVKRGHLREWIAVEKLGQSTSLFAPIVELLATHETITLVTDQDGIAGLVGLNSSPIELVDAHQLVRLLRLVRRG